MARPDITAYIGANARGFHDAMARIRQVSGQTARSTASDFDRASSVILGKMKGLATGLVAGIAAGGVAGIAQQFREIASEVAAVGDEAKRSGVSARAFQEWKIVAEQARIPVDAMVDGLKELALRGDEFAVTGKGAAAEAFARLGYGAADLKKKLEDPSALLLEIIERLGKFDKAAQIRISDELFGGSAGERFVELLDQGADGIRRTIDQAHELGNVMSDEMIARAAEVDRQFQIVSQTVGTALKGAIVDAASALSQFIDSFNAFENQRRSTLTESSTNIDKKRLSIENRMLEAKNNPALNDRTRAKALGSLQIELDRLNQTSAEVEGALARIAATAPPTSSGTSFTPAPYTAPPPSGARKSSASDADKEAEAIKRVIDSLRQEIELLGLTETEQRVLTEQRRAGVTAASEQGQAIAGMVRFLEEEKAATEAAKKALQEKTQAAEFMIDEVGNAIEGLASKTMSAEQAAIQLAVALARAVAQAALLGSGPLAGLFKGIFGGGSGSGLGYFPPAPALSPALAQAMAPPPAFRLGSMYGMDAQHVKPASAGAIHVSFAPVIDNRGASVEAVARNQAQIARMQEEMPAVIIKTIQSARKQRIL
jgi:hypothetical protein